MSWGAVIAGGVALAGTVVASSQSRKAAKSANAAATESSEASTAFAKEQYEDWKAVYGPVQSNLSNYYANLTPDYFATRGLENFELERQSALEDLDVQLAQRGVSNSGVATQLKAEERIDAAQQRATIRSNAQSEVANAQSNFLASGSGTTAASNLQSTLNSNTNTARQIANTASQANATAAKAATTALGSLIQTGLSAYMGNQTTTKTS